MKEKAARTRLDLLLVERKLAESPEKAAAVILAGEVQVDGQRLDKAGTLVARAAKIEVASRHQKYVSRGGFKLEGALKDFSVDPAGLVCLDIGSSHGGFTDCLLQREATRVYAVDVGRGQLHPSLRARPEIVCMEATDVRRLDPTRLAERPDFVVIDVSFISLKLVLPAALGLVQTPASLIALIKPQFEAGRHRVKGGIVRDARVHAAVCDDISAFVASCGCMVAGMVPSPIPGGDGNREFFIAAERS